MGESKMSKTIVEKLNLTKYAKVAVLNMPVDKDYLSGLKGYNTELNDNTYDLIFAFVLDMESLQAMVHKVIEGNY